MAIEGLEYTTGLVIIIIIIIILTYCISITMLMFLAVITRNHLEVKI